MSFANALPRSKARKGLLLSAYQTPSHQHWCDQLQAMLPEVEWTLLCLPARHFNWRIRGNSLSWAFGESETLSRKFDFAIATSMVDVSSLRGFVPSLANIPWLVYFHENQFAYPLSQRQQLQNKQLGSPIEAQLVPLYAALCAKRIVFNSAFNRNTFLAGAERLLSRFPDHVPSNVLPKLRKSAVLPVPVDCFDDPKTIPGAKTKGGPKGKLEIVWNHRWEYDKGPELLLAIVQEAIQRNLPLRFHVVGQQFRSHPAQFKELKTLLSQSQYCELATFGYLPDRREYESLLWRADVVLSTANHDFQGLAIQEGMLRGCTPLVPDALVYPEYVPQHCRYSPANCSDGQAELSAGISALKPSSASSELDTTKSAQAAADILQDWSTAGVKPVDSALLPYQSEQLRLKYRKTITELLFDSL